jgi:Domain of unknown function (DUF4389)
VAYPIHFDVEYRPRQSRLTTFFRPFLVIPHVLAVAGWGIATEITVVLAWFAIVVTGRYPRGMFDFVSDYLAYASRVSCYAYLLTDRFPPFGGGSPGDGHPVQVSVDRPLRLSRLTTFFRLITVIPAYLVLLVFVYVMPLLTVFVWFVVIFLGRLPQGLFEVMEMPQRYQLRVSGYLFLLTDAYPWFQEETLKDPEPWAGPAV